MDRISRRRFFEDSLALLTVATLPVPAMAAGRRRTRHVSPNEKIRIAVIGVHGQGRSHVSAYTGMDDVDVVAICDADTAVIGPAIEIVTKAGKPAPEAIQDIRKLLERKDLDAVSIATPNHWHALASIWAMQAGKDVYVEKPISHNVSEGRRIVQVARKLGRICQCGTQSRSQQGMRDAIAYIHAGNIGKVSVSRGLCYKSRGSIGKTDGPQPVPATIDYDLWCGPAPLKPPRRNTPGFGTVHYDWHWFWDYGNGDIGNQGIHEMDKARWGLNVDRMPKSVIALGGRFGYVDDGETPNTELAFFDYGDSQLIFEVRGLKTDDLKGAKVGNIWYGDKGFVVAPSYSSATAYDNDGNKVQEFKGGGNHHRNFIEAMRSRKYADLNADCEQGHLSSALCHLANISYRLGAPQPFNKKTKAFGDYKEAYETFGRFEEHLAANGVSLETGEYFLGPRLSLNTGRERFSGNSQADRLLTRDYRTGFVVPEKA